MCARAPAHLFIYLYFHSGSAVVLAALSLLLVALIKERKPPERMGARQEAPISTSQKEADSSSVDEKH